MNRPLATALHKLLNAEGGQLSASDLTPAQQRALDEFRQRTRALMQQRSGRGRIIRIVHRSVVEQHLTELAPLAGIDLADTLPERAANIGRTRSSKSGKQGHDVHYLLLKTRGQPLWQNDLGQRLDLEEQTRNQGAAVLTIGSESHSVWRTRNSLWLIENQALFDQTDWLPGTEPLTIGWYSGHLRIQLIDWLATQTEGTVTLFPDYDGVGLHNYVRLKHRLGTRARFWLMPDWKDKLLRFGSNALWQDTQRDFQAAVRGLEGILGDEPDLKHLIDTMQANGLALEQEAIWLDHTVS